MRELTAASLAVLALGLGASACRQGTVSDAPPGARESPQAKAEPAPLANALVTASAPSPLGADAGPPPTPLRADLPVPADGSARDAVGWELEATMRPIDPPQAFRGKETNIEAIDAAKKRTEPHLVIDLGPGRARFVLASAGFVLPEGTELRARVDRYGHLLLLDSSAYRVVAPGALRALLDDRRLDVEPLAPADAAPRGDGGRRLGYRTRRVDVANRVGVATLEIAHIPDLGDAGSLVCRALLELMNAPPQVPVCGADDLPLHAELRWPTKQGVAFDAVSLARRVDLSAASLAAPPSSSTFSLPSLPSVVTEVLVPAADLAAFRSSPADLPAAPATDGAVSSGIVLVNTTDQLRFAWLDGVPIAWLAPGGRLALPSLLRGRYGFAWRTFLADAVEPPVTITVPSTEITSGYDAGAP